jgi:chromosome segregation ATPase
MTNANLETRLSALEAQVQDIRDLLQQAVRLQVGTQQQLDQVAINLDQVAVNLDRTEKIAESNARSIQAWEGLLQETRAIADSNARSIQAWESRINQVEEEAEEDRSVLRVNLNTLSTGVAQMQVGIDELRQASRENIAQHFDFRERFDRVMDEIEDLRRSAG